MDTPQVAEIGAIDPIFVSVKDAARMLAVSPWVCYQLLDENKIASRYIKRRRLVVLDSLKSYALGLPSTRADVEDGESA